MTGPSVPQGTGGTLVERLTEALGSHGYHGRDWCGDGKGTSHRIELNLPRDWHAHLADVAAAVVREWVGENSAAVAGQIAVGMADGSRPFAIADAALAVLVAGPCIEVSD